MQQPPQYFSNHRARLWPGRVWRTPKGRDLDWRRSERALRSLNSSVNLSIHSLKKLRVRCSVSRSLYHYSHIVESSWQLLQRGYGHLQNILRRERVTAAYKRAARRTAAGLVNQQKQPAVAQVTQRLGLGHWLLKPKPAKIAR